MSLDRKTINADDAPPALGPYSHAARAGNLVFISGQVPVDPATGEIVPGDVAAQAERCLRNLGIVARAAGGDLGGAVRCGIFLTDLGDFAAVNEVYARYFGDSPPARSSIEVAGLPLGAKVEIEAVIAVPGDA